MAMLRRTGHQAQQAIQLKNRELEEERVKTLKKLEREALVSRVLEDDDRLEEKRLMKRMMMEQREREMEDAILRAQRNKQVKELQAEQEERLATELSRIKHEETRDEKMRQHIRETSLELRELEAKLKAAYTNKERHAQLAEKEALKYDKMARDAEIAKMMKAESERAAEADVIREKEKYHERVRYQQELEKQLEEQELNKQKAYEEFLKEKLMIDEIVRKIYEEDLRERELQMEKQHMTKKYIEEFKSAQAEWKRKEEEAMAEENKKIQAFANLQREREEAQKQEKQAREEAMARVQEALGEEIYKAEKERTEMERVREELYLEEQEEAARQKEKDDIERRIRERLEQQAVYAQQMQLKAQRMAAEKEEEEHFKQMMLAKFAEDDRIEQMNAQKRRMKQLEHKRAVEQLLADRRAQYAAERERELEERKEAERMEEFRRRLIEEERQRLLREHATKLLGYLPKGVIRDSSDLDMLGSDFKQAYAKRAVDPFDDDAWDGKH